MGYKQNYRRDFIKQFAAGAAMTFPALAASEESAMPLTKKGATNTALVFNVTDFGAVGDGKNSCTANIQKAVDACARAGGGKVAFPAGRYLWADFSEEQCPR